MLCLKLLLFFVASIHGIFLHSCRYFCSLCIYADESGMCRSNVRYLTQYCAQTSDLSCVERRKCFQNTVIFKRLLYANNGFWCQQFLSQIFFEDVLLKDCVNLLESQNFFHLFKEIKCADDLSVLPSFKNGSLQKNKNKSIFLARQQLKKNAFLVGQRRPTRSLDRIQRWKTELSSDLASFSRVLPQMSCQSALHNLCLTHISCHQLWKIFRESCVVDAQNQCKMTNRNDCWQSFEGISWTGLGTCACFDNNSDCQFIRLQTNYNKCIYEIQLSGIFPTFETPQIYRHRFLTTNFSLLPITSTMSVKKFPLQLTNIAEKPTSTLSAAPKVMPTLSSTIASITSFGQKKDAEKKVESRRQQEIEHQRQHEIFAQAQRKQQETLILYEQNIRQREEQLVEQERQLLQKQKEIYFQRQNDNLFKISHANNLKFYHNSSDKRLHAKQQLAKNSVELQRNLGNKILPFYKTNNSRYNKPDSRKKTLTINTTSNLLATVSLTLLHISKLHRNNTKNDLHSGISKSKMKKNSEKLKNALQVLVPLTSALSTFNTSTSLPTTTIEPTNLNVLNSTSPLLQIKLAKNFSPESLAYRGAFSFAKKNSKSKYKPKSFESSKFNDSYVLPPIPKSKLVLTKKTLLFKHLKHPYIEESTCQFAYKRCKEESEVCRWHLSELQIKCLSDNRRCSQDQCAKAIGRFARYVPKPIVESLMFCQCALSDGECRHLQQWMYPRCLYSFIKDKPRWNCTHAVKLCQSDTLCLRQMNTFNSSCLVKKKFAFKETSIVSNTSHRLRQRELSAFEESQERNGLVEETDNESNSDAECVAEQMDKCRDAIIGIRGSYLESPCFCNSFDIQCLKKQDMFLPNNPCIESAIIDYTVSDFTNAKKFEKSDTINPSVGVNEISVLPPILKIINGTESDYVNKEKYDLVNGGSALNTTITSQPIDSLISIDSNIVFFKNATKIEDETYNPTNSTIIKFPTISKQAVKFTAKSLKNLTTEKKVSHQKHFVFPIEAYVTQKPPLSGGCATRNIEGEWIVHYKDSLFRQYNDWSGRCSFWCECSKLEKIKCYELGCFSDIHCEALHTTISFGERLYLEGRGACQCQSGKFICDTSEAIPDLEPGLYISLGYSMKELTLLKNKIPKNYLEKSGLVSPLSSVAKDIATRLQFAFERVLPKGTLCRIAIFKHFTQESVIMYQVHWYGVNRFVNDTKPKWHIGKLEKICSPYLQELKHNFLLEKADRYQLILSAVKQFRVIDLLDDFVADSLFTSRYETLFGHPNCFHKLLNVFGFSVANFISCFLMLYSLSVSFCWCAFFAFLRCIFVF